MTTLIPFIVLKSFSKNGFDDHVAYLALQTCLTRRDARLASELLLGLGHTQSPFP